MGEGRCDEEEASKKNLIEDGVQKSIPYL